jgi:RNA polymerase sigma-70 factor (sigma-E family)
MWAIRERTLGADELRLAYEAHHVALVRLAVLLTGGEDVAEDLVHDVFVRSRDRLGEMTEDEARAYLRRSLANAWRNEIRHRTVAQRAKPRLVQRYDPEPSRRVDDRDEMWRAIARLPDRQRAVIVLRYYEDLSDVEIARVLGCRQVTVRTQAKRALAKLQEAMER